VLWTNDGRVPAVDASGEQDFGSIDRFIAKDNEFSIEGDFGLLTFQSSAPTLQLFVE
jgi:hypothetical protein